MPAKPKAKRFLIVDNNDRMLFAFEGAAQMISRRTPIQLDVAESVEMAETLLAKNKYDGVAVDALLGEDKDGLEFIRNLRANPKTRRMKVILMSGWGQEKFAFPFEDGLDARREDRRGHNEHDFYYKKSEITPRARHVHMDGFNRYLVPKNVIFVDKVAGAIEKILDVLMAEQKPTSRKGI